MLGKYAPGHSLSQEGERLAREAGLLELLCQAHQYQAMLFYFQEDYAFSSRAFHMVLDAANRLDDWYYWGCGFWGIGKNLMIQEHYRTAIPWLEDSLNLFEPAGARLWVAVIWGELAVCHLGLGDDQKALDLFESALKVEAEAETVGSYQVHLANIGNVYLHRGDYYRRALALAREIEDPISIRRWSYNIRLAYARLFRAVDRLDSRKA